jgi:transposase
MRPEAVAWTLAHERTLATVRFEHPAQQIAFDEYRQSVKDAHERCERLTQALREQCTGWRMGRVVEEKRQLTHHPKSVTPNQKRDARDR